MQSLKKSHEISLVIVLRLLCQLTVKLEVQLLCCIY